MKGEAPKLNYSQACYPGKPGITFWEREFNILSSTHMTAYR